MAQSEPANQLFEYFGNIHMHTTHSDGTGSFDDLIAGAAQGQLDFVFVTDHNVLVREEEEGYRRGILTLVGQEVHDTEREESGNHLLCLGVETDVSDQAKDPQVLVDAVRQQDALAVLAHPIEERTNLFPRLYPWHSWEVSGYHGVELWNYLSSFRSFTNSYLQAVLVAFLPHLFTVGPLPAMLKKWDELTQARPVVALGGTDVHAMTHSLGPISRRFMTYEECAKGLNTHLLTETAMRGQPEDGDSDLNNPNVQHDRRLVLDALRRGRCWVGYDLAGSTKGFRFWAEMTTPDHARYAVFEDFLAEDLDGRTITKNLQMGDSIALAAGQCLRLHVQAPESADVRLLRNGRIVAQGHVADLSYDARDAGVYRVEVWKHRWGKLRGWIFSNPIYVRRVEAEPQSSAS